MACGKAIAAYLCEVERNGSEIPTVVEEVGQKQAVGEARLVSAPLSRSQENQGWRVGDGVQH